MKTRSSLAILALISLMSCWMTRASAAEQPAVFRLDHFPVSGLSVKGKLSISWDEHMIPFVSAEKDEDVPFALGLIQAHLRMGQLELMRHVSQGRISEMAGPFTIDIDRSLRIFGFGRYAKATIEAMPPATRQWAERFLEGLNAYIAHDPEFVPGDLKTLGIRHLEKWTLEELVTAWKLAATDVSWTVLLPALQQIDRPGSAEAWKALLEVGAQSTPSFAKNADQVGQLIFSFTKSGSNSIAIGKAKSKTGHGLIASDPHLGLSIPNFWIIVGFSSPSYRCLGLMLPSLPAIVLGRNKDLAWGGTNMWAMTSSLYALSDEEVATAETHKEEIKVRDWFDRSVSVRTTKWGPVISDFPLFKGKLKPTALRWVGHEVSDELSSFLRVDRATTIQEFKDAFATYAVSAQNFLVTDIAGNIAQVLAIRQPIRTDINDQSLRQSTKNAWIGFRNSTQLPSALNPAAGFIASANNKSTDEVKDLGWFYQSNDRVERWRELAGQSEKIDREDLMHWQLDTFSASSLRITKALIEKIEPVADDKIRSSKVWKELKAWDGFYRADSSGPVAFEALMSGLIPALLKMTFLDDEVVGGLLKSPSWKTLAIAKISSLPADELKALFKDEISRADRQIARYPCWSDMHRVEASHILSNVPVIGGRYRFEEFGSAGGSDTIFKTAAPLTGKKESSFYGTNARHVTDLSDLDENYFVLFGGEDGWLGSPQALDQIELFRNGNYVRLPLSEKGVKEVFNKRVEFN